MLFERSYFLSINARAELIQSKEEVPRNPEEFPINSDLLAQRGVSPDVREGAILGTTVMRYDFQLEPELFSRSARMTLSKRICPGCNDPYNSCSTLKCCPCVAYAAVHIVGEVVEYMYLCKVQSQHRIVHHNVRDSTCGTGNSYVLREAPGST